MLATLTSWTPLYFPKTKYIFALMFNGSCAWSATKKTRFRTLLAMCYKKRCNNSSLTLYLFVTVKEFICVRDYRSLKTCMLVSCAPAQYKVADCFSMTAAVWALGWTASNAPPQCLGGNTSWLYALPQQSFEINAACSTIYYPTTIQASESSVWNHTQWGTAR